MATDYEINISMDDITLKALADQGYYLYGFKGVSTTMQGGAPLVWFQSQAYSQVTQIQWQEKYNAYTSTSELIPTGRIIASASYSIDLGQTLNVTGQTGIGEVVHGGVEGAISIHNQTQPPKQFVCGVSQEYSIGNGQMLSNPICAFPLYGSGLDVMAPIQRVFLMFATTTFDTGRVMFKAYTEGVLIDLTGAQSRNLEFDINKSWSWNGGAWAQKVAAQAELAPLLIVNDTSTGKKLKAVAR